MTTPKTRRYEFESSKYWEITVPHFLSRRSSLAVGGTSSGFTVYMDKEFLKAEYNAMTLNHYRADWRDFIGQEDRR